MTDRAMEIDRIRNWLVDLIARRLDLSKDEIPTDQPFTRLGVDSTEAVVISGELQVWLGRQVPPTALWDNPTIDLLANFLAG